MAIIKHSYVSSKPDSGDPDEISADEWNDDHVVDPGTVVEADLSTDAVSTNKLVNLAVTTAKLDNLAVTTGKIANAAVTLAKHAAMATARFIGRITGGSGDPEELTGTQATTLLDVFGTALKGLVPAPGSVSGRVLTDAGTWSTIAPSSQDFLGDGSDGSPTFDGSTTILGMVPASNVYTLTRDFFFDAPIINVGVTIKQAGFMMVCKGNCTLNGIIERNGNNATNSTSTTSTAGGPLTGGRLPGSGGGGAGSNSNNNGTAAGNLTGQPQGYNTAGGAGGGNGVQLGGAGGTCTEAIAVSNGWRLAWSAMQGRTMLLSNFATVGPGGGGGGSNTGSPGGGGGGGGGWCTVGALSFSGTGSIQAKGGNGGNGFAGGGNPGGGGGGRGGVIVVVWVTGAQPTCTVTGGTPGTGAGTGTSGIAGTDGLVVPFKLGV
jgi:hypothetical protein